MQTNSHSSDLLDSDHRIPNIDTDETAADYGEQSANEIPTTRLRPPRNPEPDALATTPPSHTPVPVTYSFLLPPVQADEIGRLGTYRVLQLLGKGGMAYVFLAEDIALKRRVALKVMRPELEGNSVGWRRFLNEAQIMASIKHEHLVTLFQVGEERGVVYLAMEWLQGETLEDRIVRAGRLPVADVLRLGKQIAAGLNVIHKRGLIHRDIKPGNIWVSAPDGDVKILDFGLARLIDDNSKFTQTGMIVGTPAFMSPEQARGQKLDGRTDLFSLGGVLHYLCTGMQPFQGENTLGVLTALAVTEPRAIHELNPAIPVSLSKLVKRLLAKDPSSRPPSAKKVLELLQRIEANPDATSPSKPAPRVPSKPVAVLPREKTVRTPVPEPETPPAPPLAKTAPVRSTRSPKRRRKKPFPWIAVATIAATLAGISAIGAFVYSMKTRAMGPTSSTATQKADVTFLSELKPIQQQSWIAQPPRPSRPPHEKGPPPFRGVEVHGQSSPHGIFMHPPLTEVGGTTWLRFRLDKQYGSFTSRVALNDGPSGTETPLTFSVFGDGALLWKSKAVHSQADAESFTVSVKNVTILTIQVDCPGRPRGAHAVWIEPSLKPRPR